MTPKEKFNKDFWYVLQEIEKRSLYTTKGRSIEYAICADVYVADDSIPTSKDEAKILEILQEESAIKIKNTIGDQWTDTWLFYLEIIQPKFDEIYKKFQILNIEKEGKKFDSKVANDLNNPPLMMQEIKRRAEEGEKFKELEKKFNKNTDSKIKEAMDTIQPRQQNGKPYCEIKGKWGFLKLNKWSRGIKIGNANSQPFKLLQCLSEPLGTAKAIDTVFEAIRESVKYKSKSGMYTSAMDKAQKTKLIEYAIKELQKDNKLQGKFKFRWDDLKIKIWLEYFD